MLKFAVSHSQLAVLAPIIYRAHPLGHNSSFANDGVKYNSESEREGGGVRHSPIMRVNNENYEDMFTSS